MKFTPERGRLVQKMFDAALKEKMSQLARKYDPGLVFELWTRMAKTGRIKPCSCKGGWKPNMTIAEAIDCLDNYCNGLENLLQQRQATPDDKHKK